MAPFGPIEAPPLFVNTKCRVTIGRCRCTSSQLYQFMNCNHMPVRLESGYKSQTAKAAGPDAFHLLARQIKIVLLLFRFKLYYPVDEKVQHPVRFDKLDLS